MKKQLFLLFVMALALLWTGSSDTLLSESKKPRFYIKFKGNASFSSGGDFGDFVDRNEIYFDQLNIGSDEYVISTTRRSYFQGFGGEIGLEVKKHAVGIGVGYISQNFKIGSHYEPDNSDYIEDYVREYEFSAIPIFLFIHYKIVDRRFIKAFLTLGEGVYLATYRDDRTMTFENADRTFANSYVKCKKNHLGFHAGVSIDFNIFRHLALFVDAGYRVVSFKEMKADEFYEDDNVQELDEEKDFYYGVNRQTDQARFTAGEAGGMLWDEELAKLNLSGFSLSVGMKIIF
jgi:hypothetical protein